MRLPLRLSTRWLQPLLRAVLLCTLTWLWLVEGATVSPLLGGGFALAALLILTGFGARIGALLLVLLWAWQVPFAVTSPLFLTLLFSTVGVLLLGSGRFSLWQGDDHWIARHDGAS